MQRLPAGHEDGEVRPVREQRGGQLRARRRERLGVVQDEQRAPPEQVRPQPLHRVAPGGTGGPDGGDDGTGEQPGVPDAVHADRPRLPAVPPLPGGQLRRQA